MKRSKSKRTTRQSKDDSPFAGYPGPQIIKVAKGLTREEANRRAKKRATRDWRGFTYDPETGIAKLI